MPEFGVGVFAQIGPDISAEGADYFSAGEAFFDDESGVIHVSFDNEGRFGFWAAGVFEKEIADAITCDANLFGMRLRPGEQPCDHGLFSIGSRGQIAQRGENLQGPG